MSVARSALLILDLFVAVTAISGGIALVSGLERNRFSTDILRRTPFRSFFLPGLLLAVVVGGSAAVAFVSLLFDGSAGAAASVLAGALLTGFVTTEVLILEDRPGVQPTEVVYLLLGLLMIVLGAIVWLSN